MRLSGIKQKKWIIHIVEPQNDFFCFIPLCLKARYEHERLIYL